VFHANNVRANPALDNRTTGALRERKKTEHPVVKPSAGAPAHEVAVLRPVDG
jgi:hypothetical protein